SSNGFRFIAIVILINVIETFITTTESATEPTQSPNFFICQYVLATVGHAHRTSGFVIME
ncbi:hypothetical protein SB861_69045, partial [Paraburkholderia sp. SIMBA_049]